MEGSLLRFCNIQLFVRKPVKIIWNKMIACVLLAFTVFYRVRGYNNVTGQHPFHCKHILCRGIFSCPYQNLCLCQWLIVNYTVSYDMTKLSGCCSELKKGFFFQVSSYKLRNFEFFASFQEHKFRISYANICHSVPCGQI